jgi:hypothetical protein
VRLALPDRLVPPAPRVLKASKDPSDLRAQLESRGRLALRDRRDRSARRGRREKRVLKAQSDPVASADHQDCKAPLAHLAPPDQLAPRVTPAQHRQFASSLVRIAFAAKATKSWLVFFAQAVRPTERNARSLARQQPVYVHVGDLSSSAVDHDPSSLRLVSASRGKGPAKGPALLTYGPPVALEVGEAARNCAVASAILRRARTRTTAQ